MQIARLHTCIFREELKSHSTRPDRTVIQASNLVRETPESYYQPTVEFLNAILKKQQIKD